MVGIIDTHAHLYANELTDLNYKANAKEAGVQTILMPNIDELSIEPMLEITKSLELKCIPMLGLHPCYVTKYYKKQLNDIFLHYKPNTFCAIGEIGLDLYWDKSTLVEQQKALIWQIEKSIELQLPVALHTRAATLEVLDLLTPYKGKISGVFHCFGDELEIANKIIDLGFKLGIGGIVTFKNSGLNHVLKHVNISNILIETDSPYLAPMPFRGKINQPSYTTYIVEKIAEIMEISKQQVIEITTQNAIETFALNTF